MDPNTHQAGSDVLAQKIVPLLQALSEVEDKVSAIALRLDPIVNHSPSTAVDKAFPQTTVTGRLQTLGDTLQYLLDHIEL